MAKPELPVFQARPLGERLVDELAGDDGVRGVVGIGGGDVVVFAGIDDDAKALKAFQDGIDASLEADRAGLVAQLPAVSRPKLNIKSLPGNATKSAAITR